MSRQDLSPVPVQPSLPSGETITPNYNACRQSDSQPQVLNTSFRQSDSQSQVLNTSFALSRQGNLVSPVPLSRVGSFKPTILPPTTVSFDQPEHFRTLLLVRSLVEFNKPINQPSTSLAFDGDNDFMVDSFIGHGTPTSPLFSSSPVRLTPVTATQMTTPPITNNSFATRNNAVDSPAFGVTKVGHQCLLPEETGELANLANVFLDALYQDADFKTAFNELMRIRKNGKDNEAAPLCIMFSVISIKATENSLPEKKLLVTCSGIFKEVGRGFAQGAPIGKQVVNGAPAECFNKLEVFVAKFNKQALFNFPVELQDRVHEDLNKLLVAAQEFLDGKRPTDESIQSKSGRRCAERSLLGYLTKTAQSEFSVNLESTQAYKLHLNRDSVAPIPSCDTCTEHMLAFYVLVRLAKIASAYPNFISRCVNDPDVKHVIVPLQIELNLVKHIVEMISLQVSYIKALEKASGVSEFDEFLVSSLMEEGRILVKVIEAYFTGFHSMRSP